MAESARPDWATERTERYITIAFLVIGALFLGAAVYSGISQYEAAVAVWNAPGDRDPSRAVMHVLNHEILAGFIGAVLVASGALRWRAESD